MKYRRKRSPYEDSPGNPRCKKCGKHPFNSEKDVLRMMEVNNFLGHAYRCGNIWHHGSSETRGAKKTSVCELPILHSLPHAIEAIKVSWAEDNPLPNVKICRHWSHGNDRVWHVVEFDEGVLTRARIRKLLNPERYAMDKRKKNKSRYRNNELMIESWENEGGATWQLK